MTPDDRREVKDIAENEARGCGCLILFMAALWIYTAFMPLQKRVEELERRAGISTARAQEKP